MFVFDALRTQLLTGRLVAETRPVATLEPATRAALWSLYARYYERVDAARFETDLADKDDVIVVRDGGDLSVQGFTTLKVFAHDAPEGAAVVVYSGDTVIAPRYWGQTALQRAFVAYVMRQVVRAWPRPVYWFLISKGVRTYLLMSRNFLAYWPRHDRPTPPAHAAMLAALGRRLFADAYREALGVIRHDPPGPRLAAGLAPLDHDARARPDVGFFLAANPGADEGDELCCLGRVDLAMGANYVRRLARRTLFGRGGS